MTPMSDDPATDPATDEAPRRQSLPPPDEHDPLMIESAEGLGVDEREAVSAEFEPSLNPRRTTRIGKLLLHHLAPEELDEEQAQRWCMVPGAKTLDRVPGVVFVGAGRNETLQ